jgi:DnaJ-class molecular chaperone
MICEACRGSGRIVNPAPHIGPRMLLPCPECNGTGITSCCDAAGSAQPVPAWPYFIGKERS